MISNNTDFQGNCYLVSTMQNFGPGYNYNHYLLHELPEEVDGFSWDSLCTDAYKDHDPKKDIVFLSTYLSGSDYSGSLVEKSNYTVFKEMYGNRPGVYDVWGGYGTYGIAITLETLEAEENEDIRETLSALENYPVLDEEEMSRQELEAQEEALESWALSDFKRSLINFYTEYEESEYDRENYIFSLVYDDNAPDDVWKELFYLLAERANEYWVNESGDSMWIDVDRIARTVEDKDILRHFGKEGVDYDTQTLCLEL